MKTSIAKIATAIALTALVAGPAAAMVTQSGLNQDVLSALSADSNISATVQNGVVTLSGYFADAIDKNAALQAALDSDGVERVINNAFQSN